jgi:hypothetical protein
LAINSLRGESEFHVLGLLLKLGRSLFGCDLMQVAPEMDEQSNRHAHDHQRAHAKNQEPPDHPHSAIRITEAGSVPWSTAKGLGRGFALGHALTHHRDALRHELEAVAPPFGAGDGLFDRTEKLRIVELFPQFFHVRMDFRVDDE